MTAGRRILPLLGLLWACGDHRDVETPDAGNLGAPACHWDLECPFGQTCVDGACVPFSAPKDAGPAPCATDRDCAEGAQCVKSTGACVLEKVDDGGFVEMSAPACQPGEVQSCGTSKLGECRLGASTCAEVDGGWAFGPCVGTVGPTTETCDGKDNDCDGLIDDLPEVTCGVGACERRVPACTDGAPTACTPGTPTAETCNGVDDDCNGLVDDGLPPLTCGVGACARSQVACTNGVANTCTPGTPTAETCNGVDDDCNGLVDDGLRARPVGWAPASAAHSPARAGSRRAACRARRAPRCATASTTTATAWWTTLWA